MSGAQEQITVEWIAMAQQFITTMQKVDKRLEMQEKAMQKLADTGKKGAAEVAGSFNKLEQELKENEAALKRLKIGSKEFDEQRKKVDALKTSLAGARGQLTKLGGGIGGALSGAVGQMGALVAGMVSFQTVVSGVVAELDKIKQIKLASAEMAKTVEQAMVDMAPNLAGMGAADVVIPKAKAAIETTAMAEGVDQVALANLVGVAVSAGAKSIEEAIKLSLVGLKLTAGDANKALPLVGGMLDIAGKGNTKDFEGSMGQLLQAMGQARATNLNEFASNMGPGVAAATGDTPAMKGMSTEQALETIAVFTQRMGDQTGAKSSTALLQFFNRLGDFAPQRKAELDNGDTSRVTQPEIDRFKKAKTFNEKRAIMQQNPEIMNQFVDTQREGNIKSTIREFLEGSKRLEGWRVAAEAAITPLDEAAKKTRSYYTEIEKLSPAINASRATAAVVQAEQVKAGLEGEIQSQMETVFAENLPGMDTVATGMRRTNMNVKEAFGVRPAVAALSELDKISAGGVAGNPGLSDRTQAIVESAKAQIERLDKLIKLQEDQIAIARANAQRPAAPQRAALPNERPRVAPMPGATVP